MNEPCAPSLLRKLLDYNPSTGEFAWKPRTPDLFGGQQRCHDDACVAWNNRNAGLPALIGRPLGYRSGYIFKVPIRAHRVAWALYYGEWPKGQIDHINGDRSDNRIVNLRVVTPLENRRNQRLSRRNSSGFHGVSWCATRGKWRATINVEGSCVVLGRFTSKDEAIASRRAAEQRYGFHPNHGRKAPT